MKAKTKKSAIKKPKKADPKIESYIYNATWKMPKTSKAEAAKQKRIIAIKDKIVASLKGLSYSTAHDILWNAQDAIKHKAKL